MSKRRSQSSRGKKGQADTAPYVLVVYEEGKETGVVRRTDVPADATKGTKCAVPDPIDWSRRSSDLHDAIVVEFGHDIDYLYEIRVSPKGKILKNPPTDEVLAKKREEEEYQRKLLERKRNSEGIINDDVEGLNPLTTTPIVNEKPQQVIVSNDANKTEDGPSTSGWKASTSQSQCDGTLSFTTTNAKATQKEASINPVIIPPLSNLQSGETHSFTFTNKKVTEDKNYTNLFTFPPLTSQSNARPTFVSTAEQVPQETTYIKPVSLATTSTETSVSENIRGNFQCPSNCDCCPIAQVLAGASPSQIDFFLKMSKAIATHSVVENSTHLTNRPIKKQPENYEIMENYVQGQGHKNTEELECLKPGPDKHPILKGFEVYVTKPVIMSIPPIYEAKEENSSNSPFESLDSNRPKKKAEED